MCDSLAHGALFSLGFLNLWEMFLELVLRAQNIGSDSDWTGGARSATVKAVLATH